MAIRKQEENIDTVVVRESTRNTLKVDEPNLLGETLWKQGILITKQLAYTVNSFETKTLFRFEVH